MTDAIGPGSMVQAKGIPHLVPEGTRAVVLEVWGPESEEPPIIPCGLCGGLVGLMLNIGKHPEMMRLDRIYTWCATHWVPYNGIEEPRRVSKKTEHKELEPA